MPATLRTRTVDSHASRLRRKLVAAGAPTGSDRERVGAGLPPRSRSCALGGTAHVPLEARLSIAVAARGRARAGGNRTARRRARPRPRGARGPGEPRCARSTRRRPRLQQGRDPARPGHAPGLARRRRSGWRRGPGRGCPLGPRVRSRHHRRARTWDGRRVLAVEPRATARRTRSAADRSRGARTDRPRAGARRRAAVRARRAASSSSTSRRSCSPPSGSATATATSHSSPAAAKSVVWRDRSSALATRPARSRPRARPVRLAGQSRPAQPPGRDRRLRVRAAER